MRQGQRTIRSVLCAALAASVLALPVTADPLPQRVVSINLCADELLIALADPAQIADLSTYATDPSLAFLSEEARRFRHDAGAAETVVAMAPDLVLAGRFSKRETRAALTALGYRIVELEPARSIADSVGQIRKLAALLHDVYLGQPMNSLAESGDSDQFTQDDSGIVETQSLVKIADEQIVFGLQVLLLYLGTANEAGCCVFRCRWTGEVAAFSASARADWVFSARPSATR